MTKVTEEQMLENKEIKKLFNRKHKKRAIIIDRYEEANEELFLWNTLTKDKLEVFVDYLQSTMSPNSARTYSALLKSFLNTHDNKHSLGKNWENCLNVKSFPSSSVVLDESEIDKLLDFALNKRGTDTENAVVALFCVSAITGARWIDALSFKRINLDGDTFEYVSKKSRIKSEVYVSPSLPKLVKMTKRFSLVTFNNTIREVCRKLKMNSETSVYKGGRLVKGAKWEFVSSHTARRSFATNLYKRGADLHIIAKMMGHASYNQTRRYIISGLETKNQNIINFFNK